MKSEKKDIHEDFYAQNIIFGATMILLSSYKGALKIIKINKKKYSLIKNPSKKFIFKKISEQEVKIKYDSEDIFVLNQNNINIIRSINNVFKDEFIISIQSRDLKLNIITDISFILSDTVYSKNPLLIRYVQLLQTLERKYNNIIIVRDAKIKELAPADDWL
ncbi:MAG: hypothetical protein GF317_05920 [Candidatus Lokiarchaeota archaeon]|nr:hypothetical protein [Candidatus Lokiarchaeota archaeon]